METEQGSYEGRIKAFVGLFASVEGQMHYCEARLTEIAGELQDIYHEIELGEFPGDEGMRHFYLRIRELRQERRRLKDEMIMLGPFRNGGYGRFGWERA